MSKRQYRRHDDPRYVWASLGGTYSSLDAKAELTRLALLDGQTIRVFKKAYIKRSLMYRGNGSPFCIVELEVHRRTTLRRQPFNYKCRAASAKVIALHTIDQVTICTRHRPPLKRVVQTVGKKLPRNRIAYSGHDPEFLYRVGERVKPRRAFDTRNAECGHGIHFFLTQKEALEYSI